MDFSDFGESFANHAAVAHAAEHIDNNDHFAEHAWRALVAMCEGETRLASKCAMAQFHVARILMKAVLRDDENADIDEVLVLAERAFQLDPNCHEALNLYGLAKQKAMCPKDAERFYRRAIEAGSLMQGNSNLGALLFTLCDSCETEEEKKALELEAELLLRRAIENTPPNAKDCHDAFCTLARLLQKQGKFDEAGVLDDEAEKHTPNCALTFLSKGQFNELVQDNVYAAAKNYQKAMSLDGHDGDAAFHLADLLENALDDPRGAEVAYLAACNAGKPQVFAFQPLGQLLFRSGKFYHSAYYLRKAVEFQPDNALAHFWLGSALQRAQNAFEDSAISAFEKALDIGLDTHYIAQAHYNVGLMLQNRGDFVAACTKYHAAIDVDAGMIKAHYNLACTYVEAGEDKAAEAWFRRTLEIDSTDHSALCNLGNLLLKKDDVLGAKAVFSDAIENAPNNGIAQNNYGVALQKQGDFVGAREAYEAAIKADPHFEHGHYNLAVLLHFYLQDAKAAQKAYSQTMECCAGDSMLKHKALHNFWAVKSKWASSSCLHMDPQIVRCGLAPPCAPPGAPLGAQQMDDDEVTYPMLVQCIVKRGDISKWRNVHIAATCTMNDLKPRLVDAELLPSDAQCRFMCGKVEMTGDARFIDAFLQRSLEANDVLVLGQPHLEVTVHVAPTPVPQPLLPRAREEQAISPPAVALQQPVGCKRAALAPLRADEPAAKQRC